MVDSRKDGKWQVDEMGTKQSAKLLRVGSIPTLASNKQTNDKTGNAKYTKTNPNQARNEPG